MRETTAEQPLWEPGPKQREQSNMARFIRHVEKHYSPDVIDYPALYNFSIGQPGRFWEAVWEFCAIRSSRGWDAVVDDPQKMPGARWFEGARLNFAQNLLRQADERPALTFDSEAGHRMQLSRAELADKVNRLAWAMRELGVQPGDRVAGFMPNLPHTLIAMLAAASIGAVWSSCSPDFGVQGALDRFAQIEPVLLFAADGYPYNGKSFSVLDKVADIAAGLPTLKKTVIIPYLERQPDIGTLNEAVLFNRFLHDDPPAPQFEQLPFDHPLYILFSSGTTGKPKCIIHSAGGTLLQHMKELVLHTDLKKQEHIFYFTTCGWMMWNWLVSALAAEAVLVLYDGSPFHPGPEALFQLAERRQVDVFGTSAKWLSAVEKSGYQPANYHDLSRVRTLLSTGSPLLPAQFDWVYSQLKADVQLCSISGGTDIVSCFALGNPLLPVWRGELQGPGLGMKVEILNEQGQPVREQPGELSCSLAFPSMPVGFWNDPEGKRYHAAYFERFPQLDHPVWAQGDRAEYTRHGGLIIYGRSDATLNPGGVRIGTAEIYRQVEQIPEVVESLAVGQQYDGDERVVLFVVLKGGLTLDDNLQQAIRKRLREHASPRHVPAVIVQVPELPRTRSGKITELAVRDLIHGREIDNTEALANPEALAHFRNLGALQ